MRFGRKRLARVPSSAMTDHNTIRLMTAANLEAVLAVERLSHRQPWSRQLFVDELGNTLSRIDLLWIGCQLAGFHCYWVLSDEMHILNLATAPAFRRRGVARSLLRHALGRAGRSGVRRAFLEVRSHNEAAIALYRSLGFVQIGIRRGYYADGEDALVMELAGLDRVEWGPEGGAIL
jgi:ribosomal-protein-alanine N-acetyltransferase